MHKLTRYTCFVMSHENMETYHLPGKCELITYLNFVLNKIDKQLMISIICRIECMHPVNPLLYLFFTLESNCKKTNRTKEKFQHFQNTSSIRKIRSFTERPHAITGECFPTNFIKCTTMQSSALTSNV